MKRKSLVIIEMLLSIIISVGIFFLIFNVYFIFKGFGKDILYINDKNREYIENNGYNEGKLFIFIGIIVIFICIGIYGIKKEISKQIDFIDKDNYWKRR